MHRFSAGISNENPVIRVCDHGGGRLQCGGMSYSVRRTGDDVEGSVQNRVRRSHVVGRREDADETELRGDWMGGVETAVADGSAEKLEIAWDLTTQGAEPTEREEELKQMPPRTGCKHIHVSSAPRNSPTFFSLPLFLHVLSPSDIQRKRVVRKQRTFLKFSSPMPMTSESGAIHLGRCGVHGRRRNRCQDAGTESMDEASLKIF